MFKPISTFITLTGLFVAGMASAIEIKPYSAQALDAEQASGRPVALHFHADWCPTRGSS